MSLIFGPGFPPDHRTFGPFVSRDRVRGTVLVASGVPTDIWPFPGTVCDFTASGQVSVVSTSAQDNPSGTGIGSVLIFGSSFPANEVIFETLPLTGETPVLSTAIFKNPLFILDAASVGSGASEFDIAAAAGTITATVGGANSDVIQAGQIGNRSFGAVLTVARLTGGGAVTSIIDRIDVSIGRLGAGQGQVEIGVFRKRGSAPPLLVTNPLTFETNVASDISIAVDITLQSDDIVFARVTDSDQDVQVSVDMGANTYGPAPA